MPRLFLFLSVFLLSFNASAALFKITSYSGLYNDAPPPHCGIYIGAIVDATKMCIGYSWENGGKTWTRTKSFYSSSDRQIIVSSDSRNFRLAYVEVAPYGCPSGTSVDDQGICSEPPTCEDGWELNPDTNECQEIPFCESSDFIDEYVEQSNSCAASGGAFTFSCSDFFETADFTCADKSNCVIGAANWPSCLGDIDPTAPIDEPSGGFDGGSGDTANPNDPWEKDEPDPVTPDETTDTALLQAVQNMNRDQNQALGKISSDMNQGFADTNTALNQLNSTNNAIGQSIVDQMNQDYQLAKADRELQSATTGAVMNAGAEIVAAVGANGTLVAGAIGDNGDKLDAINGSLGDIADLLGQGEACEPTADNNYCENPHGLGHGEASDLYSHVSQNATDAYTTAETDFKAAVDIQASVSPTTNSEMEQNATGVLGLAAGALSINGQCSDITIPTMIGERAVISCQFSQTAKAVISFVFYIYTIYSISTLLISGITPVARRV